MLVLTRKSEESVILGGNIEVKVLSVRGDQVSLGFAAPNSISIYRKEVYEAIQEENRQAATRGDDAVKAIRKALRRNGDDPDASAEPRAS